MIQYHKIQSVFKRDWNTKKIIDGDYTLPEFKFLKDNTWDFTEKFDGMNVRIMFDGETVTFGGKTDRAQMPKQLLHRLEERFLPQLELFKCTFDCQVCFYGEGIGSKIQKGGGLYRADQDFILFDILIDRWWLTRQNLETLASRFNIDIVPIIGRGTLSQAVEKTRQGFNSVCGNFIAEGIVARPHVELKLRNGQRIITKIKYKDFAR